MTVSPCGSGGLSGNEALRFKVAVQRNNDLTPNFYIQLSKSEQAVFLK